MFKRAYISIKINDNPFKEISDNFPNYFENIKQTNQKLLYISSFDGLLPKISITVYSWIWKWANLNINIKAIFKFFFGTTFVNICWPQAEIVLIYN